jgi:hypothetical protein
MSFRTLSQTPRLLPRPLRGLGALQPTSGKAWYIPLIEHKNTTTGYVQSYQWGAYKYLSYYDAMSYFISLNNYGPGFSQEATLYQWDGSQWRKTPDFVSF